VKFGKDKKVEAKNKLNVKGSQWRGWTRTLHVAVISSWIYRWIP